jgi:hypothetical protein
MAVRPIQLENRERDMHLDDRKGRTKAPPPAPPVQGLAKARALQPSGSELHWRQSWELGRDAACAMLESGQEPAQVRRVSPPNDVGCRSCWDHGRAAVLKSVEGAEG